MKTSAIIIVAAAAALASAQAPPLGTNKVNCAKPNAAYCLGGDIILRCDENKVGTAGRCSANVAGYPPLGGVASCYQSGAETGDAACVKNCVVYAQPSFTLPASECTPSYTASATAAPTTLAPTTLSSADGPAYTVTVINGTRTVTVPCETSSSVSQGTKIHYPTYSVPVGGNHTAGPTVGPTNGHTNTPVGPTGTTGPTTVPTAGAATNGVAGALAVVGIVAAFFI